MSRKNSVFRNGNDTHGSFYNACVGDNGRVDNTHYAKGFSLSVNILIDSVLSGKGKYSVDEIIYPICFNLRHSVELYIKCLMEIIENIDAFKRKNIFFDWGSIKKDKKLHDVASLWNEYREKTELFDDRFFKFNDSLSLSVLDIGEVDSTGETFRYAFDRGNGKHLTKESVINIEYLKDQAIGISNKFDNLVDFSLYLKEEYEVGVCTDNVSRQNIYKIIKKIPLYENWGSEEFSRIKKEILAEYDLSSKEFGRVLDKAKNNYELSCQIGIKIPLQGVTEEDIECFLDSWVKYHPEKFRSGGGIVGSSDTLNFLLEESLSNKYKTEYWDNVKKTLTPEILAGLNTLYQLGRERKFSEYYKEVYKVELKESNSIFEFGQDDVYDSLMHIFDKSNFLENILFSLYFIDYRDLADRFVQKYNAKKRCSYLEKARGKDVFKLEYFHNPF